MIFREALFIAIVICNHTILTFYNALNITTGIFVQIRSIVTRIAKSIA
jgi:hypothetical protein